MSSASRRTTEARRFLKKARESLASASADVRARRYNSAANRSYYAAFQAAVASLIHWGVRSADTDWEHRFVAAEFSSKLIRRRKTFPHSLSSCLPFLFQLRIEADYRATETSAKAAGAALRRASALVEAVADGIDAPRLGERRAVYGGVMRVKTTLEPEEIVEKARDRILESYPDVTFKVKRRNTRDFTLEVYGKYPEMWSVSDCLGDMIIDALVDDDVWIVVLGLPSED